jgi:hypothetical protein
MKKLSFALLVCTGMAMWNSQAMADDVILDAHFSASGSYAAKSSEHDDLSPYKGWAQITLYNDTTDESWSGIHFSIFQVANGSSLQNVYFVNATPYEPTCTLGVASSSIIAPTTTTGAEMDVTFSTALAPGSNCTIKVYTDNTTDKKRFGVSYYPVAVPEPVTLAMLGIGGALLASRRRK